MCCLTWENIADRAPEPEPQGSPDVIEVAGMEVRVQASQCLDFC